MAALLRCGKPCAIGVAGKREGKPGEFSDFPGSLESGEECEANEPEKIDVIRRSINRAMASRHSLMLLRTMSSNSQAGVRVDAHRP
ncbi:hypothetical protein [Burkholderia sp. BE12]|uniref:hypothetical protein n=1 Tax=Burkholderia sp. BE12 TaxID=2082394 RepID=UPI001319CFB2|nr:hypothetical protein [Burkholderia sp. BE12]